MDTKTRLPILPLTGPISDGDPLFECAAHSGNPYDPAPAVALAYVFAFDEDEALDIAVAHFFRPERGNDRDDWVARRVPDDAAIYAEVLGAATRTPGRPLLDLVEEAERAELAGGRRAIGFDGRLG